MPHGGDLLLYFYTSQCKVTTQVSRPMTLI